MAKKKQAMKKRKAKSTKRSKELTNEQLVALGILQSSAPKVEQLRDNSNKCTYVKRGYATNEGSFMVVEIFRIKDGATEALNIYGDTHDNDDLQRGQDFQTFEQCWESAPSLKMVHKL